MFIILSGCCKDFSPFPLHICRSWGSEERLQGPGKRGGRTQHSNRNCQRFQGRWAGKDQREKTFNPVNVPEVINELRRGMLWKQRAHKQLKGV